MARLYGVDPELALERTNKKFISRFGYMEQAAGERMISELSFEELDTLWNEAKKGER